MHGQAEVIDIMLVYETVEKLPEVQAARVALYNVRCTGNECAAGVGGQPSELV